MRACNYNKGNNDDIVQGCAELNGYVEIVSEIHKNKDSGMNLKDAIEKAIKDCVERNILTEFLKKHGGEVLDMLYAEWNLDDYVKVQRREAVLEGIFQTALRMLSRGKPIEEIVEDTGLSRAEVEKLRLQ